MNLKFSDRLILFSLLLVGAGLACNLPIADMPTPTILTIAPTLGFSPLPSPQPSNTPTPVAQTSSETGATPEPTTAGCVPAQPAGWINYAVQPGDTLFRLAVNGGTTVEALMQVNCRTSTVIYVGEVLFVPQGNSVVQSTPQQPGSSSPPGIGVSTSLPPDTREPSPLASPTSTATPTPSATFTPFPTPVTPSATPPDEPQTTAVPLGGNS